jgi:hypothetical protein
MALVGGTGPARSRAGTPGTLSVGPVTARTVQGWLRTLARTAARPLVSSQSAILPNQPKSG